MAFLFTEMLVYLAIALAIGLVAGWLIWGRGRESRLADAREEGRQAAEAAILAGEGENGASALSQTEIDRMRIALAEAESAEAEGARRLAEAEEARDALSMQRARLQDQVERLEAALADCKAAREAAEAPDAEDGPRAPAGPAAPAPKTLLTTRPAEVDDLKRIKGVGPVMERVLNERGVYLFHQLANFTAEDVAWVNEAIEAFPGRIERDEWVSQAQALYAEKYGKRHDEE